MSVQAIAEVWEYAPESLSPTDLLVLLAIADAANSTSRIGWESVDTMVKKTRSSRSSVHRALQKLAELNIVQHVPEDEWPFESRRYSSAVRRINPVDMWGAPETLEIVTPEASSEGSQDETGGSQIGTPETAKVATPCPRLGPNPVLNTNNQRSKRDFVSLTSTDEDRPGRRTRSSRTDPDQELDHQALVEQELFGEPEPARRKPKRQIDPDTGLGLALHFERQLVEHKIDWSLGSNHTKLAKQFNDWKRNGVTPDIIRKMIDLYVVDHGFRNSSRAPWVDFLAARNALKERVEQREKSKIKVWSWDS